MRKLVAVDVVVVVVVVVVECGTRLLYFLQYAFSIKANEHAY